VIAFLNISTEGNNIPTLKIGLSKSSFLKILNFKPFP